jgi:hypothetical protein
VIVENTPSTFWTSVKGAFESVVRRMRPNSPLLSSNFVPVVYRINMRDPNSLFVPYRTPA